MGIPHQFSNTVIYIVLLDDPRLSFYGLHKAILQKDDPRQK